MLPEKVERRNENFLGHSTNIYLNIPAIINEPHDTDFHFRIPAFHTHPHPCTYTRGHGRKMFSIVNGRYVSLCSFLSLIPCFGICLCVNRAAGKCFLLLMGGMLACVHSCH